MKRRDQAASNQRRLAAARGADDRQETSGSKPAQQVVDFVLATEKEMVLVRLEGPKSREWVDQSRAHRHTGDPPTLAFKVATKGASGSGVQPSN